MCLVRFSKLAKRRLTSTPVVEVCRSFLEVGPTSTPAVEVVEVCQTSTNFDSGSQVCRSFLEV